MCVRVKLNGSESYTQGNSVCLVGSIHSQRALQSLSLRVPSLCHHPWNCMSPLLSTLGTASLPLLFWRFCPGYEPCLWCLWYNILHQWGLLGVYPSEMYIIHNMSPMGKAGEMRNIVLFHRLECIFLSRNPRWISPWHLRSHFQNTVSDWLCIIFHIESVFHILFYCVICAEN